MDIFAIDVKNNTGRALGDQLHQNHLGEMTLSRAFDACDNIDLLQVLALYMKRLPRQGIAKADTVPHIARGIEKDFLVGSSLHHHIARRNPAIPLFPTVLPLCANSTTAIR